MLDRRLLEYLAVTAEEGSIGGAARALQLSQPTVSHQIRRLEQLTGLTLFERRHDGVTLTRDGVAVLDGAHDVLAAHRRLDAVVADLRAGHTDQIDLGLIENVPPRLLAALLAELASTLPGVRIDTSVRSTPDNVVAVRTAVLDAAIVRGPLEPDAALRFTLLAERHLGVLLPDGHRLAASDHVDAGDLAAEPLLMYPRTWAPQAYDRHARALAAVGVDLTAARASHNVAQTAGFVDAGLGLALVADGWFSQAVGLQWRPLVGVELVDSHHLVTRGGRRLPRVARAVHAAAEVAGASR